MCGIVLTNLAELPFQKMSLSLMQSCASTFQPFPTSHFSCSQNAHAFDPEPPPLVPPSSAAAATATATQHSPTRTVSEVFTAVTGRFEAEDERLRQARLAKGEVVHYAGRMRTSADVAREQQRAASTDANLMRAREALARSTASAKVHPAFLATSTCVPRCLCAVSS